MGKSSIIKVGSRVTNVNLDSSDQDIVIVSDTREKVKVDLPYRIDYHYNTFLDFIQNVFDDKIGFGVFQFFGVPLYETPFTNFLLETREELFYRNRQLYYKTLSKKAEAYKKDFLDYYIHFPKCLMVATLYYYVLSRYPEIGKLEKAIRVSNKDREMFLKLRQGLFSFEESKDIFEHYKQKTLENKDFYLNKDYTYDFNLDWIEKVLKFSNSNISELTKFLEKKNTKIP